MKKQYTPPCNHQWIDIFVFKDIKGDRYLQQQCKKCKANQHIKLKDSMDRNESEVGKDGQKS